MKYLIVNGDDFGAGRGVNRAIIELYDLGVLTSASLMIDMPAAPDAVKLAKSAPGLSVGLHVALTDERCAPFVDFDDRRRCVAEMQRQIDAFCAQLDRLPTHIDSHQNVHRDARLTAAFKELASRYALPLREHSDARYFSNFYGQWDDGESHPEQIGLDNLLHMLDSVLHDGVTELSCHPGYATADFSSSYASEREIELQTLSDPRLLAFLRANEVQLISFRDLPEVARVAP